MKQSTETQCARAVRSVSQSYVNKRINERLSNHDKEFEKVWKALSRGDAQVRAVAESVRLMNERQARYGNIIIGFCLCLMTKELGLFTVLKGLIL